MNTASVSLTQDICVSQGGTININSNNNVCYIPVSSGGTPLTWFSANDLCVRQRGSLPSINNVETNAILRGVSNRNIWIGYNRNQPSSWSDGSPFSFTNWNTGNIYIHMYLIHSILLYEII